jgi:hypothetical protein
MSEPTLHTEQDDNRKAGLPDGLFSNQKSHFGYIWEGLAMENVSNFYDHLECMYILGHLVCMYIHDRWV